MKKKVKLNNIKFSNGLIVIALLFFVVIIIRISYLSLSSKVDGIDLQEFASNRTNKKEILKAKRGSIFDVNGNVLAENVSSYTVIAYLNESRSEGSETPQHVVDKEYTAKQLATVLDMSEEKILSYLNRNLYQTEFGSKGKGLTELTKDEILALNLPGIDFIETQKRHYPYGNFLSYAIGYAKDHNSDDSSNQANIVGEMGIEKSFNDELSGEDGFTLYQKDRNGYKIAGTREITKKAVDGKDVYLTVDSTIQLFVEQAIASMSKKYNYDWMTIMVADAKTGAILASATSPSFDPNIRNITNYLDYNVSYAYEPGSTMKIYSYMAAMETGKYDGNQKYKSGVYVTEDGTEIGDWNRSGWGNITLDQGFALSSNTAVITLINKYMSGQILKDYYKKLGFGSKTGIELPDEVSGKLGFKYETEVLNAGFGQGLTTTPVQNIKALTAISNNGVLLKPYIIDKIVDPNTGEIVYEGKKEELGVVASNKTVSKIKSLMKDVINGNSKTSTGYPYYMKGYDIIGKTGTAQVANESGTGYTKDSIRGFAGMFPGDDPQIILYVAAKNPGGSGVGPMKMVVQEIIKNVSNYLGIYDGSEEENEPLNSYTMKSYISKDIGVVKDEFSKNDIDVVVIGNGDKVIKQYPESGSTITKLDKVFLLTNGSEIKMPSIIGYSSRELYNLLGLLNIKYEVSGTGYVSKQSIKKDTILTKDSVLKVTLELKFCKE